MKTAKAGVEEIRSWQLAQEPPANLLQAIEPTFGPVVADVLLVILHWRRTQLSQHSACLTVGSSLGCSCGQGQQPCNEVRVVQLLWVCFVATSVS